MSNGTSVRRSITSRSKPRAAPFSAASSAVVHHARSRRCTVTCVPSRTTFALPSGIV